MRKEISGNGRKNFIGISHCGFIRARHNKLALRVMKCFANEMGLHTSGLISAGGTSIIGGMPLEEAGFFSRNIVKGFKMMIDKISEGKDVSKKAVKTIAKRVIPLPIWLLARMITNMRIKEAKKNGIPIDKL